MTRIHIHEGDLPENFEDDGGDVAIDTETMGLTIRRDPLKLAQLSIKEGEYHLIRFNKTYDAPRLKALLADSNRIKIFHYARFDIAALQYWLGAPTSSIYCTKIASRLTRTYGLGHGLKDLCEELLDVSLDKTSQCSNWGREGDLTEDQKRYAVADVAHLRALRASLDKMLAASGRSALAAACFAFLPARAALDIAGWEDQDIFAHM